MKNSIDNLVNIYWENGRMITVDQEKIERPEFYSIPGGFVVFTRRRIMETRFCYEPEDPRDPSINLLLISQYTGYQPTELVFKVQKTILKRLLKDLRAESITNCLGREVLYYGTLKGDIGISVDVADAPPEYCTDFDC